MRRQNSVVSTSSRRENAPEKLHAKTIGCMSGILHFISKSHSPSRFLTFGKKQIKNESSFPAKTELSKQSKPSSVHEGEKKKEEKITNAASNPRFSCEIPRSPTLPAEIRRSNPVKPPPDSVRTTPALVVRLMGLEDYPASEPETETETESVSEKRQRLLGALQKCDEDLKALKKIIEAVRCKDQLRTPSPAISNSEGCFGGKIRMVSERNCSELKGEQQQQPSPVSVLEEFNRSRLVPISYSRSNSYSNGKMQAQQKQQLLKKPGEEEISNAYFYERMTTELVDKEGKEKSVMWSSKGMIESVEEVCRDIAWGEKRELGRIGLALQDHICRDLIEEIVRELGSCCCYTLPFEACKRRLCF